MGERATRVRRGTSGRARGRPLALVLVLACAAEFMVVLDASVVNVALPSIQAGLGVDPLDLPWVVNAYALVFAGFLLLGGRLADLYGHRRVFLTGVALFAGASAVGGLAPSAPVLVGARAVQALGAAVLAPVSLTIVTTRFPDGPRRVRALAIWAALASAGGAAGNLLGGVLTALLSWRATLLINVPLGAVALVLAVRTLGDRGTAVPERSHPGRRRLDVPGAVAATLGVTALTLAITEAERAGWRAPVTVGALAAGLLGLGAFVLNEARFAPSPLIPPRVFRLRAVALGNLTMLLAGACLMPMWYFLSLYMQQVLGYTSLVTGLGFLPLAAVTVLVGGYLAPPLMARVPGRTLIACGSLVAAAGFWWQSHIGANSGYVDGLLGPTVIIAVGGRLLNTPLTAAVTTGVTSADAGAAAGLMNTTKQVGAGIGLAALVTLASAHTGTGRLTAPPAGLTAGFATAFAAMAALMTAVAVLALVLPGNRETGRR